MLSLSDELLKKLSGGKIEKLEEYKPSLFSDFRMVIRNVDHFKEVKAKIKKVNLSVQFQQRGTGDMPGTVGWQLRDRADAGTTPRQMLRGEWDEETDMADWSDKANAAWSRLGTDCHNFGDKREAEDMRRKIIDFATQGGSGIRSALLKTQWASFRIHYDGTQITNIECTTQGGVWGGEEW